MAPALLAAALLSSLPASAKLPGVHLPKLRWEARCILHATAGKLADDLGRYRGEQFEAALRAAASTPPRVRPRSATPIEDFRRALARQYADAGADPAALGASRAAFTNLYAVASDEVFLLDAPGDYARLGGLRSPEDALAHEFVHFLQVRYYGYTPRTLGEDPGAESQAVEYQNWFRETFVKTGAPPPCP